MGYYKVLGSEDGQEWLQELKILGNLKTDVHYLPEYCGLYRETGEPKLFVYREEAGCVVYPFLLRKVNLIPSLGGRLGKELFDITSPYGYGGPLAGPGTAGMVLKNFRRCFEDYCAGSNIVTEFIRFHPLLANQRLLEKYVEVERVSAVVCIDLRRPEEEIWSGYDRQNRKNISKALREGLQVILEEGPEHFADFVSIYRHTMERNGAGRFYFFSSEFFDNIHSGLKGSFLYAHTIKDTKIVSTELLFYNETYIHSFLGGTLAQFFECRPNNLLKHEVIKWAKGRGIRYFMLGGGRCDGDGIFRYKRTFARNGLWDFYIGKKVHDAKALLMLDQYTGASNPPGSSNFFPSYRRAGSD